MRSYVLVAVVVCATLALVAEASRLSNWREWQAYKQKYGKVYESPEEDARRFGLFLRSKARLSALRGAQETHERGLNHLSDWSDEEFKQINGFRLPAGMLLEEHAQNDAAAEEFLAQILAADEVAKPVPKSVDWRKVPGRVSGVKDQKHCGSCWAFSTTGMLEGQEVPRKIVASSNDSAATVTPLSEQDLVDCSKGDYGCEGGLMGVALEDIAKLGGIESERDYPYVGLPHEIEPCRFAKAKSVMSDAGPAYLPAQHEDKLKAVVARYGPVSVAMDAHDLSNYKSGIYEGKDCTGEKDTLTHGVLIVGYGSDPEHGDFWIVKNSWGPEWGEAGYFRIARGKNTCAIAWYGVIAKF